jgi:predicted dinucleotide-binding enzyme
MKIGILGSGNVAKTLGGKLAAGGHEVKLGSRSPEKLAEWVASAGAARAPGRSPRRRRTARW